MKEIKINLPIDCEIGNVSAKIENGGIVVMCEPKKEFKFGDFVRIDRTLTKLGIVLSKCNSGNYVFLDIDNNIEYNVYPNCISEAHDFERIDIQHYLNENNLVIDYEKKKIVKKRWRAEKGNTFYYVSSSGIVLNTEENFWECNNNVYECGNYFRTKEQAEKVAKEVREVFEKHKND